MPVGRVERPLDFGAHNGQIVWIDKMFRVISRRQLIAAMLFGGGVEEGKELVIEGEHVLLHIVFPVGQFGNLECLRQIGFVAAQSLFNANTTCNIMHEPDNGRYLTIRIFQRSFNRVKVTLFTVNNRRFNVNDFHLARFHDLHVISPETPDTFLRIPLNNVFRESNI